MPYLKRINSLPLINHISYKYAQVSDIGPSWSSCFAEVPCGQDTSEPQPSTGKTKEVQHVSCRPDMSDIMLKAA